MQAQVKEMYFIFNFEYMYAALSRGMLHRLSIKSHAQQKSKYPTEMSETQCPHTLHTSLNQKKIGWSSLLNWMVQFGQISSNS
jgi:hypothetical protein